MFIGTTAQGLTAVQLSRITFSDPEGFPAGNYPSRILVTGEIVPAARPALAFSSNSGSLIISWLGDYQLLSATNIGGPYVKVMNAQSPYTNSLSGAERYFKLGPLF